MTDPALMFREAMQEVFGVLELIPVADGAIHRFKVPGDKAGTRNGWYVLFLDGIASGAFGSWKIGGSQAWSSREPANQVEAEQIRRRIEDARRQREAEQRRRQTEAGRRAAHMWSTARPADPGHPYLARKGIRPHRLRQLGDVLLVPLYDGAELVNVQRILPDGDKRFLSGGKVKGCYSPLGSITPERRLYICEGWATGATIHEATGSAVACAMNAGNLLAVALALRAKYGHVVALVIAGDDDRQTDGNPGRTAANAAAAATGALVTFPDWPAGAPPTLSDFNDLATWSAAQ